ncbi:MAG: hypothetical protein RQ885_07515, partial [Desulfurococcales archaeon]|nr:hypothetical protein [Desulfurococcales archaeon]
TNEPPKGNPRPLGRGGGQPTEPKYYGLIIATAVSYAAAFLVLHKLSESLLKLFYIRIKQKQRKIQNDNN